METGRSRDEADIRGIMRRYFPNRSGEVNLLSITRGADGQEGARADVGGVTAHRAHERPGAAFAYSEHISVSAAKPGRSLVLTLRCRYAAVLSARDDSLHRFCAEVKTKAQGQCPSAYIVSSSFLYFRDVRNRTAE